MNLNTMKMNEQELKQLKIEVEGYFDGLTFSSEEIEFANKYINFDERMSSILKGFYSGFKAALYTMQRYPELLEEKKDEKKD